jgi:hypothetical protein
LLDGLHGLAAELANDTLETIGHIKTRVDSIIELWTLGLFQADRTPWRPVPTNDTNAGIFGADMAPAVEIAVLPLARVGYIEPVSSIPGAVANLPNAAETAAALRNAAKSQYRLNLPWLRDLGRGDYSRLSRSRSDRQLKNSAATSNRVVDAAPIASGARAIPISATCP